MSRHVCVVLLTGLGDVVHGLPVVNAIRRHHEDWRITWVVEPMPAGLLAPHPSIDRVVVFRKKDSWRGVARLAQDLRGERFDLTLNLNIYFKSVFPTVLSRAPRRVGFDRGRARDGVWLFCNDHLEPGPRRHTQDLFLEFLDRLGVPAEPLEWRLQITEEEREQQRRFFSRIDRPVAAVAPVSANPRKDWPAGRFAGLADALDREFGFQVVIVGGPGARDSAAAAQIVARTETAPIDARSDGVRRLIWLLEGCRLLIAPDTGPVHIARALDVPVVGLYGHTNPWRIGPYRRFEDLWVDAYNEPDAEPDASLGEPRHGRMERITVDDVLQRVRRVVDVYLPTRA